MIYNNKTRTCRLIICLLMWFINVHWVQMKNVSITGLFDGNKRILVSSNLALVSFNSGIVASAGNFTLPRLKVINICPPYSVLHNMRTMKTSNHYTYDKRTSSLLNCHILSGILLWRDDKLLTHGDMSTTR